MSHLSSPLLLLGACVVLTGAGCGSDHNRTASAPSTPGEAPPAAAPMERTPTGQPPQIPPDQPSSTTGSSSEPSGQMQPASGTVPSLSQGQVAMLADLANTAEIEQGKVAEAKAKNPRVKKFASMMVKHHSEAKQEQAKLFKTLNLTAIQSPRAIELKDSSDKVLGSLRGADGAAFDRVYMDSQVEAHQKVLDLLDRELLPAAASDQELLSGLKKMRATVESHLSEAKTLQAELNAKASGQANAGTR